MLRRRSGRLVTAVLCLGLIVGGLTVGGPTGGPIGPSVARGTEPSADRDPTPAEVIDQVRADLAESSEAMVLAATDLRLAEAALPAATRTVQQTDRLLAAAKRRQTAATNRRGDAQVRLMLATQNTEQITNQRAEQHARIGRLARAVYQSGGSLGNLSTLLDAKSPADFAERMVALRTVASSQRSTLDDLQRVETSYGSQAQALERIRDETAAADKAAQQELTTIAQLASRAQAAEAEVTRLVRARDDALAAARAAQAQDDRQHQALQGESSSLQRDLGAQARSELGEAGARPGSSVTPRPGTLAWPATGPITSPFGMRVHPITGVLKLHTGTDLGVPCGTQVHVARDGVVVAAGYNTAYGYRTVVSHGVIDGVLLTTTYNHQSHIGVAVGQHVTVGQIIGLSGTTGYSTGCHLHFELIVNADFVDPVPWLSPR